MKPYIHNHYILIYINAHTVVLCIFALPPYEFSSFSPNSYILTVRDYIFDSLYQFQSFCPNILILTWNLHLVSPSLLHHFLDWIFTKVCVLALLLCKIRFPDHHLDWKP